MQAVEELATQIGRAAACRCLGLPRATLYRRRRPVSPETPTRRRRQPPRALSDQERTRVLDVLHSEPFADKAPAEAYATLLDQGQYLCSIRTMYRILDQQQEVRERRDQLRHPTYQKPQLVATAPNQVWSWDITSRPHVSDDNPFSESQFKTMKYRPEFPDRFTGFEHGLDFCGKFFHWQNHEHHHWGLGLLTPAMVHYGRADAVLAARQQVLTAAHAAHPERFGRHPPRPLALPREVRINPPAEKTEPRLLQLTRDTNFVPQLSQTH